MTNSTQKPSQNQLLRQVIDLDYLKDISQTDFLNLGMHHIVYIKPQKVNETTTYAMHAADGTYMSSHENAEMAALMAVSNDMAPVTLH